MSFFFVCVLEKSTCVLPQCLHILHVVPNLRILANLPLSPLTCRRLSRKATTVSPSNDRRGTPNTDRPPIRLAGGTVPVRSGSAPQASESTKTTTANINGSENRNGGAGTRACGTTAGNGNGAAADSDRIKPSVSVAGHTHDKGYSKWAKFDVDAALQSVDQEEAEMDEKVGGTGW